MLQATTSGPQSQTVNGRPSASQSFAPAVAQSGSPPPATTATPAGVAANTKTAADSTLESHNSLQTAKDRAQITASTSMSIVHVALLKQLLDNGSDAFTRREHFYLSIALIVTALSIQVLAGFVALYIAFMRKYMRNDKFTTGDYRVSVWPWRLKKRSMHRCAEIEEWISSDFAKHAGFSPDDDGGGCCWWCPWECKNQHFMYNGRDILHIDNYLHTRMLEISALRAKCDEEMKNAESELQKCAVDATLYHQQREGATRDDTADVEKRNQRRELARRQALTRLTKVKEKQRDIDVRHAQYSALQADIDAIQSEIMMKQAQSWQNVLNGMLYTVFVLNAFIAAFGVSSAGQQAADIDGPSLATTVKTL